MQAKPTTVLLISIFKYVNVTWCLKVIHTDPVCFYFFSITKQTNKRSHKSTKTKNG